MVRLVQLGIWRADSYARADKTGAAEELRGIKRAAAGGIFLRKTPLGIKLTLMKRIETAVARCLVQSLLLIASSGRVVGSSEVWRISRL